MNEQTIKSPYRVLHITLGMIAAALMSVGWVLQMPADAGPMLLSSLGSVMYGLICGMEISR